MKIYSISKWAFWAIFALILSLPAARQWKLILYGSRAEGVAGAFVLKKRELSGGRYTVEYASRITFRDGDTLQMAFGPYGYEYKPGRTVKVLFDRAHPSRYCVATFSGFYLENYTTLPLVLLIVWSAFYLSFNRYAKKGKGSSRKDLASSPYAPFRGTRDPAKKGGGPAVKIDRT